MDSGKLQLTYQYVKVFHPIVQFVVPWYLCPCIENSGEQCSARGDPESVMQNSQVDFVR